MRRQDLIAALVLGTLLQPVLVLWPAPQVVAAKEPAQAGLQVNGAVNNPRIYTLKDLQSQQATSLSVYYNTSKGAVSAIFTGVLLWSLLQEATIKVDPAVHNDLLRHAIKLTAADGYEVVLSAGEIAPNFGGEQAIVAYEQDGAPLPASQGFARLVVPGDKTGGRSLFRLIRIEVQ